MRALLAILLVLAAGCSGSQIRGRVVRGSAGPGVPDGESDEHELPLADGRVTVECPEGAPGAAALARVELEADLDGRFSGSGEVPIPMDCAVRVEAAGYAGRRFPVPDVCTRTVRTPDEACAAVTIRASLPPVH